MTRRVQTLLTGVVILSVLGVILAFVRVPYVALVPGPSVNTLGEYQGKPVVELEGKSPNTSNGTLNLTTLGVVDELTIFEAIGGWFSNEAAVVPREVYYPPTRSREETTAQNRKLFVQSESAAIQAAMNFLDLPQKIVVVTPPEDSQIAAGDALEAINGQPVTTTDELAAVMETIDPGTTITVSYLHNGEPASTTATTTEPPADSGRDGSLIGMTVNVRGYGGFTVSFAENDIGGPSAGLVLTLAIIDLAGPEPLVDDEFIAGTGTISPDGEVGPIGGIRFKILAATEDGAELFLTPTANCDEALADLPAGAPILAEVASLQDAVDAIESFQDGTDFATCS